MGSFFGGLTASDSRSQELAPLRCDEMDFEALTKFCLERGRSKFSVVTSHMEARTSLDLKTLNIYRRIFSVLYSNQKNESDSFFSKLYKIFNPEEEHLISFPDLCTDEETKFKFPDSLDNLKKLNLSPIGGYGNRVQLSGEDILALVSRYGENLESLDLSACLVNKTSAFVKALADKVQNLTHLSLSCNSDAEHMEAAIVAFAERNPKLKQINVSNCNLTDVALKAIADHCPDLERIDTSDSNRHGEAKVDKGFETIARQCSKLSRVIGPAVNSSGLDSIAQHCSNLVEIDFSTFSNGNIPADVICKFLNNCKSLEKATFSGWRCLTDAAFSGIHQERLNLSVVNFSGCKEITDETVVTLAKKCPELVELDLSDCEQITDASLIALFKHCPKLEVLKLTNCPKITDAAFQSIEQSQLPLSVIYLNECSRVTGETVEIIAAKCPELKSLCLYNTGKLNGSSIISITEKCKEIEELGLGRDNTVLGSNVILAIARNCNKLSLLSLLNSNCSEAEFFHLVKKCTHLKKISFVNCSEITEEGITKLRRPKRGLDVFYDACPKIPRYSYSSRRGPLNTAPRIG